MEIKIAKKKKISEMIVDELMSQIQSGQIKPGERLPNERMLSESLGVSRMPLREAIHALGQAGIVETRHGEGTFVCEFNSEKLGKSLYWFSLLNTASLLELAETRKLLEVESARLACINGTDVEIEAIHAAMIQRETWVEVVQDQEDKKDLEKVFAAGREFHEAIIIASHNSIYMNFLQAVKNSLMLHQQITATHRNTPEETTRLHREIYKAISGRDSVVAVKLMSEHLDQIVNTVKAYSETLNAK